jgi:hypothetical protein
VLDILEDKLTSIPFASFEMVEKANGEPVVIYEIFKLLNCIPKNSDDRFEYDATLIIVLNNQLFIKQKRKNQVDVFFNHLFNHLTGEGHFLFFIETESSKERISLLKKKVEQLLLFMDRKWIEIPDLEGPWSGMIVDRVIETDLGY